MEQVDWSAIIAEELKRFNTSYTPPESDKAEDVRKRREVKEVATPQGSRNLSQLVREHGMGRKPTR